MNENPKWKFTVEIIGVIGGITTVLALALGPMFYLGSKIENFKSEIRQDMNEFHKEIKDFHGRLCAIEEKNKK